MATSGSNAGSRSLLDVQRSTAERQLGSDPRRRSGEQDQRAGGRRVQSVRSVPRRKGEAIRVYVERSPPAPPSNRISSDSVFSVTGEFIDRFDTKPIPKDSYFVESKETN